MPETRLTGKRVLRLPRTQILIMANSIRRGVVLRAIALILLAMTMIPGAVSDKGRKNHPRVNIDEDIWLIAIGQLDSRTEYLDPLTGEIKGFDVDIVNAVCKIANKNCRWVEDRFSNCWYTADDGMGYGGFGLFNFYYDACTGWKPTIAKTRTFQFTDSFAKSGGSFFIVKSGNPGGFVWTDLTGKSIGVVDGFFADEACILRQSETITGPAANYIRYPSPINLHAAILAGDVDAGFDPVGFYPDTLEVVSDPISCAMGGKAMMTRKDNRFKDWFNPALEELIKSKKYVDICDDLDRVHGHLPGPTATDLCFGR